MSEIERMRKAHRALWLLACLWLAVGWGLVWPTRPGLFNLPGWVLVVGLLVVAVLWVAVIFRHYTGGSYSPCAGLFPDLLFPDLGNLYWGKWQFGSATRRVLLIQMAVWVVAAGWLAIQGYQRLGSAISLLAASIIVATTIAIYRVRARLTTRLPRGDPGGSKGKK